MTDPVSEALAELVALARAQRGELEAVPAGAGWTYEDLARRTAERCPEPLLRDALGAVLLATDWLETVTTGM